MNESWAKLSKAAPEADDDDDDDEASAFKYDMQSVDARAAERVSLVVYSLLVVEGTRERNAFWSTSTAYLFLFLFLFFFPFFFAVRV